MPVRHNFLIYHVLPSRIIQVVRSPGRRILLNADQSNETIDIFYSGTGDTNNMDFSFVTRVSIPNPKGTNRKERLFDPPTLVFSAEGTKFAAGTADGVVSVWEVRSKIPLKIFKVDVARDVPRRPTYLQFSSGILGKEVLVFMEVSRCLPFPMYLWNKWPLEPSFNRSEDHPPNWRNIVRNGRNSLLT